MEHKPNCLVALGVSCGPCPEGKVGCLVCHPVECTCNGNEVSQPSSEGWEKEYEKKFDWIHTDMNEIHTRKELKEYIRNLLSSEKQKVLQEVLYGLPKQKDRLTYYREKDGFCFDENRVDGYNRCLEEVRKIILKKMGR